MDKKYRLTDETRTLKDGTVLHRIQAVRSFSTVFDGELGGFVECEDNLSHCDLCWIYDDAMVYDGARVAEDARVYDDAIITGYSSVYGRSVVGGHAKVNHAYVGGDADITGNAVVESCDVDGDAEINSDSHLAKSSDLLTFRGFGRFARTTTMCRSATGDINVVCGCFTGNLKEFRAIVKKTHRHNPKLRKEYLRIAALAKFHFDNDKEN